MVLRVEPDIFIQELQDRLPGCRVYVQHFAGGVRLSAHSPETNLLLIADSSDTLEHVLQKLDDAEISHSAGMWQEVQDSTDEGAWPYIGAVSYRSAEEKPGIWVDGYPEAPIPAEVLKRLFDELRASGELSDVSFEEFLRLTHANVVIVSPRELQKYVFSKRHTP